MCPGLTRMVYIISVRKYSPGNDRGILSHLPVFRDLLLSRKNDLVEVTYS